jgi:large subunit ribosomal protein L21
MVAKNNTYAIIKAAGKQVIVRPGDIIFAEMLGDDSAVTFDALVTVNGDKVQVGSPIVEGVSVKGTVLGVERGPKIRVSTFKAKSNYHRVKGYRSTLKKVRIDSI